MHSALFLSNCLAEPLMSYLKSLGVLRLLGEQKDPSVRGAWRWGTFYLHTSLDETALLHFFLNEYVPTPVITPWNSASGFWGGTPSKLLDQFANATHPRLQPYRETIRQAQAVLDETGLTRKPTNREKPMLLQQMRSKLHDPVVDWIDALSALTEERIFFAPLLGTGGNDGRLEFAVNFMQHLQGIIPFAKEGWDEPKRPQREGESSASKSRSWLDASLFGQGSPSLVNASTGQFHPGGVGGPNATQGFEGNFLVNPWDYVLMLEGALLLAGSVARRSGSSTRQTAAFPFTVRPSPAGWHTVAHQDAITARQELWMPLWEKPSLVEEVAHILREGRAQVGKRPAANGTDFARAVASLGVDRGLSGFTRFAFYQRSGKSNIAAPLGYLPVQYRSQIDLLEEVDPWLRRFRRQAQSNEAPESLRCAIRAVDNAIFAFCREGRPRYLQDVLIALGHAEQTVARSKSLQKKLEPLQGLSLRWLKACNDETAEFYLASALGSLQGVRNERGTLLVPPCRAYLEPVRINSAGRYVWDPDSPLCVWGGADLSRNLVAVLERRCLDAERLGLSAKAVLAGHRNIMLKDMALFLEKATDDERVVALLKGFALLRWPKNAQERQPSQGYPKTAPANISRMYALCKLFFHHQPLPLSEEQAERAKGIAPAQTLLSRLKLGESDAVVRFSAQKLRAAGLGLLGTVGGRKNRLPELICHPGMGPRITAALLFPVNDIRPLVRLVLRNPVS